MENNVVLISGGGSGFGKAMALRFAQAGGRVLISGRRASLLAEVTEEAKARKLPGEVNYVQADMSSMAGAETMVRHALDQWGQVDVMINNAGGGIRIAPFDTYTDDEIKAIVDANLYTAMYGSRAVIPHMKKVGRGVIINVSSVCARHAWPEWSVYTAAKMGILGFSRCLYGELRPHGIKVGSLIPGAAPTDFAANAQMAFQLEGESMQAEDVAESAYLMASLPARAFVEELVVWGTNQEVIPL